MIKCKAIVENPTQRDNLCRCCVILGVKPNVVRDAVSVSFNKKHKKAEDLICLFENYTRHEITKA
jgi:hypothetical protein